MIAKLSFIYPFVTNTVVICTIQFRQEQKCIKYKSSAGSKENYIAIFYAWNKMINKLINIWVHMT